jgi:hypothetical protein
MNTSIQKWGLLNGNQLKIIGIIMMACDHVHQMFIAQGAPDWLNWIGRPVAPLFLFLCAEGFYHTRSKKRYMLLLFIGFEFMNFVSPLIANAMVLEEVALINNIFGTLLLATIFMYAADLLRQGVKEKKVGRAVLGVLIVAAFALLSVLFLTLFSQIINPSSALSPETITMIINVIRFIPNPVITEGGFALVLLGLLFYLFRGNKLIQILILAALSTLVYFTAAGAQWMMVFAFILILLYNGAKGSGNKYFFYIFYPAHIYILYAAAWFISAHG